MSFYNEYTNESSRSVDTMFNKDHDKKKDRKKKPRVSTFQWPATRPTEPDAYAAYQTHLRTCPACIDKGIFSCDEGWGRREVWAAVNQRK